MIESAKGIAIATWAKRYITTFDLALVSIEPGEKTPKGMGWNKPGGYITDAATAEAFWQRNPNHNLGVVLGPSRVCSLDVDDVQWTRHVLYELLGVDLDAMALVYPTIVGNPARFRVVFKVPEGIELTRHGATTIQNVTLGIRNDSTSTTQRVLNGLRMRIGSGGGSSGFAGEVDISMAIMANVAWTDAELALVVEQIRARMSRLGIAV